MATRTHDKNLYGIAILYSVIMIVIFLSSGFVRFNALLFGTYPDINRYDAVKYFQIVNVMRSIDLNKASRTGNYPVANPNKSDGLIDFLIFFTFFITYLLFLIIIAHIYLIIASIIKFKNNTCMRKSIDFVTIPTFTMIIFFWIILKFLDPTKITDDIQCFKLGFGPIVMLVLSFGMAVYAQN